MTLWILEKSNTDRIFKPIALLTLKIPGITPTFFSMLGVIFGTLSGVSVGMGHIRLSGVLLLISGLLDTFDGVLARTNNMVTQKGGFLDSCLDRYTDSAIFLGICWYFVCANHHIGILLSVGSLTGALMTPYARAKAEQFIKSCQIGILERPHRTLLLIVALLFQVITPILWIILVLSHITVLQRILYTTQCLEVFKKIDDINGS